MVRAATLLAEIGDCRERFPSDDALAALAGASPSTRQSGKREQTVFRWSCNKKLRAAVMDFANGSRMADPWAADIYRRAITRGCRHPHAIRILARAWIRIIWRCATRRRVRRLQSLEGWSHVREYVEEVPGRAA